MNRVLGGGTSGSYREGRLTPVRTEHDGAWCDISEDPRDWLPDWNDREERIDAPPELAEAETSVGA